MITAGPLIRMMITGRRQNEKGGRQTQPIQ
jgi:hypothetical protein